MATLMLNAVENSKKKKDIMHSMTHKSNITVCESDNNHIIKAIHEGEMRKKIREEDCSKK